MTAPTDPALEGSGETSLAVLSRRIASELNAAALVCRSIEDLAASLAAEGGTPLERLSPLQSLDELTQRLSNLATVLDTVADRSPAEWSLELAPLLEGVRLGDLAQRLSGAPASGAVSGEADIF
jgi:hypothetical protein